ncbi:MAG TPA: DNA-binding response regulator [Sphingobium sp.]|jgi:DNA-binding response OmpR family regulator|uniref:response regulator transcription factor n=1 Tax=unclassified Sphingobium TaxID=2611147 RepID=UPI0007F41E65|nr:MULTISPECIES: response regulator transcription factor [unclassified Sphingobium]OAN51191.1 DNA-binding response regulator [Sphingobium sp. TCM1]WIW87707.1 response regulator transcription factor [Sphingobium sp. V4]HAF43025.1 DNA-binding response regulator [Sphingobium sp.]
MPQSDQISVLLVEDDAAARVNIAAILSGAGMVVEQAEDGQAGLHRAGSGHHDVIILDRMLPYLSGIDVVTRMRVAGVGAPVLMLSALGRSEHRVEGLESGVDDYLAKPFEPDELVARVRALWRRASRRSSHDPVLLFGDLECHVKARTAFRQGRHLPLSPKEFELFRYLMDHAGEVVTREMLLRHVWKLSFDPQTNVVDVNVGRLRRKLEDGFDSPVLETVWGTGYRLIARNGQAIG